MDLLIIVDSQQRFNTEIGQVHVLRRIGSHNDDGVNGGSGGGGIGGGVGGGDGSHRLVPLVLIPLALRVLSMADQRAHLTESFAARFARKRFVLHVHVPVAHRPETVLTRVVHELHGDNERPEITPNP